MHVIKIYKFIYTNNLKKRYAYIYLQRGAPELVWLASCEGKEDGSRRWRRGSSYGRRRRDLVRGRERLLGRVWVVSGESERAGWERGKKRDGRPGKIWVCGTGGCWWAGKNLEGNKIFLARGEESSIDQYGGMGRLHDGTCWFGAPCPIPFPDVPSVASQEFLTCHTWHVRKFVYYFFKK
jgi:hypothetical protein